MPLLAISPPRGEKKFKNQDLRFDNVSSRFGVPGGLRTRARIAGLTPIVMI
jgi:hypothetical protein